MWEILLHFNNLSWLKPSNKYRYVHPQISSLCQNSLYVENELHIKDSLHQKPFKLIPKEENIICLRVLLSNIFSPKFYWAKRKGSSQGKGFKINEYFFSFSFLYPAEVFPEKKDLVLERKG